MDSLPPTKRARLSPDAESTPVGATAEPTPAPATPPTTTNGTSVSQTAAEQAVGITEYVNPSLPSWTGVLKQRYTDFLVNEVDYAGNVVHLKTAQHSSPNAHKPREQIPEDEREEKPGANGNMGGEDRGDKSVKEMRDAKREAIKAAEKKAEEIPEDALEKLSATVPAEVASQIITLSTAPQDDTSTPVTTPGIADKDARSAFHGLIRELFRGRLLTSTTTDSPPAITVERATATSRATDRRRSKRGGKNNKQSSWADLGGEYCHFTLYKENRDTMEVLNLLARLLKLKNGGKAFSFAGTKDRRAVTVQRCAAHMVKAERLAGLNKGGDGGLRGARLGDFEYKPHGLNLGDLRGNEFVITLRQAASDVPEVELEQAVKTCVDAVKKTGFANYYGLQRFGSYDITTSDIGVHLLATNWRAAVEKILSYDAALCSSVEAADDNMFAREDRERAEACKIFFTTYDFEKASNTMPRKFVAESTLLRYFKERGMKGDGAGKGLDYLGAIQAIPRGLRTMYVHAYQSLVWNHVLSARLRMSPTSVLAGDLVFVEKAAKKEAKEEVDQDGGVVIAPMEIDDDDGIERARAITAEEAASGKFSIADVVLPMPGWDIEYPANEELMNVYTAVMAKDGLDPRDMKRSVRDFSLTGSYRKMMSRFVDDECSYEVKRCKVGEQVVSTDLETLEQAASGDKRKRDEAATEMEVDAAEETVVVLRMRLGTSCYATMALRELMKGGCRAFKPAFGR